MDDSTALRLRIGPQQTQLRRLARGSRITVSAGTVRVEGPPQWLAEMLLRAASTVRAGAPVELQHAGWIRLESEGGADVLIEPSGVQPNRALAVLRALVRRWRRRIRAASAPSHAA
jgi:hypothetical protein